ncbi:acyltransferase family protein [Erwinia sp. P7711]|uniref:acyltransferase family protein n=1 Tax=Erwinia sp. P7711 TaxID=3141451 RepID=UPI00318E6F43
MRYRPEIDGLRALAVVSVVLYHAGVPFITAGFIGVDIFFVISGYLITTNIISDISKDKFTISGFYERRARRILPALLFMIIAIIPISYYYLLPDDIKSFWKSILAVCMFVSNYFFSSEIGYFAPNVELKPLLHTWSLSVEEQFYLIFPLFLMFVLKKIKSLATIIIAILAVVSFCYSDIGSITNPTHSFYSIASRSWELLVGALASFYFKGGSAIHQNKIISSVGGFLGLALISISLFYIDQSTPFPGRYALIPVMGTLLVIIFCSVENLPGKILALKPVVFIGVISYSLYLWHQPVLSLLRHKYVTEPSPWIISLSLVITVAIAYLSWRYVESPFRNKTFISKRRVFKLSAFYSLGLIIISILGIQTSYLNRFEGNPRYIDINNRMRGNYGISEKCEKTFLTSKNCMTSKEPEILVWGDSYGMQMANVIKASKPDVKMVQATVSQCAPVIGASYAKLIYGARECIEGNDKVFEYLKRTPSIKYVVLASPFEGLVNNGYILQRDGKIVNPGSKEFLRLFYKTIDEIKSIGRIPVVIAPPIKFKGNDIGYCLKKSSLLNASLSRCNFDAKQMPDVQRRVYETMKEISLQSKVIWMPNFTCHHGKCEASENGVFFYRDKGHLPYEGSEYLGKKYDFYKMVVN